MGSSSTKLYQFAFEHSNADENPHWNARLELEGLQLSAGAFLSNDLLLRLHFALHQTTTAPKSICFHFSKLFNVSISQTPRGFLSRTFTSKISEDVQRWCYRNVRRCYPRHGSHSITFAFVRRKFLQGEIESTGSLQRSEPRHFAIFLRISTESRQNFICFLHRWLCATCAFSVCGSPEGGKSTQQRCQSEAIQSWSCDYGPLWSDLGYSVMQAVWASLALTKDMKRDKRFGNPLGFYQVLGYGFLF